VVDLFKRSGIDVDEIDSATAKEATYWEGFYKDNEGEAHKVDQVRVVLSPTWESGPEWPVVQPAAAVEVRPVFPRAVGGVVGESDRRVTVILPDPQIGYLRISDGEMVPTHDEKAMAVALQIVAAAQPDRVVNLGDFLDLAEWSSKFLIAPEFVLTTQAAVDRGHRFLAEQRAAAPARAVFDLIPGNHDDRLGIAVAKNALAALRLRRANAPETWPVLSLPNLLRLDDLDVNYAGPYPAGKLKLADAHGEQTALFAKHGEFLDMTKQAKASRVSTVQGHSHHDLVSTETFEDEDGRGFEVQAHSLGCLCRLDGAVPSTKGARGDDGRPYRRRESWQHSVGVLTETADGWWLEHVRIHDGRALWNGRRFDAPAELPDVAAA
jgi:hypothetical protein